VKLSKSISTAEVVTNYVLTNLNRSSTNLRCVTSVNTLERRREELQLQKLEADIKQQQEEIRLKQLENEKLELDLIERRLRIQES